MFHRPRRLFGPVAAVAAVAIAFPLGVLAAITFSDVPVTNPFYSDIQAIANAGVTTGCGGGKYCPEANVTRGQMAAFMNRLGALGADKTPVVNADKLDGYDSTSFLRDYTVVAQTETVPADGSSWVVACPAGMVPLGGGWKDHSIDGGATQQSQGEIGPVGSYPTAGGWAFTYWNPNGTARDVTFYLTCARSS